MRDPYMCTITKFSPNFMEGLPSLAAATNSLRSLERGDSCEELRMWDNSEGGASAGLICLATSRNKAAALLFLYSQYQGYPIIPVSYNFGSFR